MPPSRSIRLYWANCYAVQDPVGPVGGAGCSMRFNKFHYHTPSFQPPSSSPLLASYISARVVHSTVLQIKPACTSLIEQNFNTGSTRNSAPWVTKHRVNTMVHTGLRCKRHDSTAVIERKWGGRGVWHEWQRIVYLDFCWNATTRTTLSPVSIAFDSTSGRGVFFRRARLIHR